MLNGEKAWITNAGVGKIFVVLARTDPEAGTKGISAFVVPADAPGFAVGTPEEKLGLKASRTAPLYLHRLPDPGRQPAGRGGPGLPHRHGDPRPLPPGHRRPGGGHPPPGARAGGGVRQRAGAVRGADRQASGDPVQDRRDGDRARGRPRPDLRRGGAREGPEAGRLACQAKVYASEAANRACWEALQIHGGNGFCEDYEIARLYRDVRVTTIYEGTSEMQRLVISRHILRHVGV